MTKTIFAAAAIIALMTGKVNLTQTDITKYDGWTRPGETEVTPVTQSIFDQAMDGIIGVNYTPVEIIGTKTTNGTDYMYRCESQVVYPRRREEGIHRNDPR